MSTPEWDAGLYTGKHSFVYEFGRELVALLAPQRGECILDLGCGSGQLRQAIDESGGRVTGLDNSASMIDTARRAILTCPSFWPTPRIFCLTSRLTRCFPM